MRRKSLENRVTANDVIGPEQATEVDLWNVEQEWTHFMERPSTFSVKPLITKLVREAYPNHPDAAGYFAGSFGGGRRLEDEVSRFPVFPLSRMSDLDEYLAGLVYDWSFPTPKYSFGPQPELHEIVARSDSPRAHNALVNHILTPFTHDQQYVFDGPDEMQYKSGLIRNLFEAATYHATPDINPWATNSLLEVYKGIRPGGFLYEIVKENELRDPSKATQYSHGPTLNNLRKLQEDMLSRFMGYPHPIFDQLVWETLESDSIDRQRLYNVLETLVTGHIKKREDGFYEEIADTIISPYDQETADLVKEHLANGWSRDSEVEDRRIDAKRRLARRIISVENSFFAGVEIDVRSDLMNFAISLHPLDREKYAMVNGKFGRVPTEGYYEDLNFLLGLVKESPYGSVKTKAAWHIAEKFKWDSAENADLRAKAAFMGILSGALSENPAYYPVLINEQGASMVISAANFILGQVPRLADRLSDAEIDKIMTWREAYRSYVASIYPENIDELSDDWDYEERDAWVKVTSLNTDFRVIERLFAQRMEWREIQTKPNEYLKWVNSTFAQYLNRFHWHLDRNKGYTKHYQHEFEHEATVLAERMATLQPDNDLAEMDIDAVISGIANMSELYAKYSRSDLRYDNEFNHEFADLVWGAIGNMPHDMKVRALELILAGEVNDFLREEEKQKLRKKVRRSTSGDNH